MASKVAVVIGYGPGIGHSVAKLWAANGYKVALISRTRTKLEAATQAIPNSSAFPCDITDDAALRRCLGDISQSVGPIDDLIYNAGNGVWKKFDEITVEQLDLAMKTNVYGFLTACQVATPGMKERGSGNVIVTGATASLRGMPITSAFAAAKAAQKSLAQSIARQLWGGHVHVAYAVIDASVGDGEKQMKADSIAAEYWHLANQPRDCWTFQHHIQTSVSDMALL